MQEKPKQSQEEESPPKDGLWEEDQKERGYYYDDAYGYEKFVDDEADESSSEDQADEA